MRRRNTFVRFLALVWATLQLASPGVSAMAHAVAARESASGPLVHIEATTSAGCPAVHSVDCAVCRYLSTASIGDSCPPTIDRRLQSGVDLVSTATTIARAAAIAIPHGRAPPTI